MSLRFALARTVGAASTIALRHGLRRPAANFPGKAGLVIDPLLIEHLRPRIAEGSVVVVGTNGKTTVTNLLADALEAAGKTVACNRTGANLDSGMATALLHAKSADWAVLESDELWLGKVIAHLQPRYVVLLNLFRDQLDRAGEIDHVQEAIAEALRSCAACALVYNADDPFCQAIADAVPNKLIPFGIDEDLALPQNTVADSGLCQRCGTTLDYAWRQYGQLGNYRCPHCDFARPEPLYSARRVQLKGEEASFTMRFGAREERVSARLPGAYTVYNLTAACAAAACCGIAFAQVDAAIRSFSPLNGRLQSYRVGKRRVLLNLAKNPVGFNENLRIVVGNPQPKAVAFFVNDKEADGRDVSWLWDVDFQELAALRDCVVYAGGSRRNDVQVRLKYAGVEAQLVGGARDVLGKTAYALPGCPLYIIANYTALPAVKAELDRMQHESERMGGEDGTAPEGVPYDPPASNGPPWSSGEPHAPTLARRRGPLATETLTIVHLYPELMNLYGDGGNVTILARRARERGVQVDVVEVVHGQPMDLSSADIVFLGGGPDREQRLACTDLEHHVETLRAFVEDDGVLLAICGGFQLLGRRWLLAGEPLDGLALADFTTTRAAGGPQTRIVGDIALESPLAKQPVIGYENHAGRTFLGKGCEPFGRVIRHRGKGNNDSDGVDGILFRNVVGTYLHGPLLAKNPEIADWLIERALQRRAGKRGREAAALPPLDDSAEHAANEALRTRFGIR